MLKLFKKIGLGIAMVSAMTLVAFSAMAPIYAVNTTTTATKCDNEAGLDGAVNTGCAVGKGQSTKGLFDNDGIVRTVINTMLFIVGLLSVIMLIYAGIRYVTAHGDKSQVEGAKNTMIYAIVGLVIAIVAYAIVNWVIGLF